MTRKNKLEDQEQSDRWLLTYADLLTLLLGFFVLMYGMSKIDSKRFERMTEGLQGVFHIAATAEAADTLNPGDGVLKVGNLKLLQQRIQNLADKIGDDDRQLLDTQAPKSDLISAEITERGLVVHVRESALFESGKADLRPSSRSILDSLALELKGLPNQLRVEGHTDSRPISTDRYPSNWELSAARASAVVRYLIDKEGFSPLKLSAVGYGEYRPRASNSTPQGMAKNRRVDIVVLTDKLSELEPQAKGATARSAPKSEQLANDDRKSFPVTGPTP